MTGWDEPWSDDDDQTEAGSAQALEAFDAFLYGQQSDSDGASDGVLPEGEDGDDEVLALLFTATNPPETVSVTALMDGRVVRIELDPRVSQMTEADLANEITTVAMLARKQALAGQYVVIGELMRHLGRGGTEAGSFLEHDLHLVSPETVSSEQARLFGAYYRDDHGRSTD